MENYLFKIFKRNKALEKIENNSYSERSKWISEKQRIRDKAALSFTLILLAGVEIGTPGYSLTESLIKSFSQDSAIFNFIVYAVDKFYNGVSKKEIIENFGYFRVIAILVFLLLIYRFSRFYLETHDPFSDNNLLRKAKKGGLEYSVFKPWRREIIFYALSLPSEKLSEFCSICKNKNQCLNRLHNSDEKKIYRWGGIFAELKPESVNNIQKSVMQCRKVFYFKYTFFLTTIALFLMYFSFRLYEYTIGMPINLNYNLIIFVAINFLVFIFFTSFNKANKTDSTGVWSEFETKTGMLFSNTEFKQSFKKKVCNYEGQKKTYQPITNPFDDELKTFKSLIEYLNKIVIQKTIWLAESKNTTTESDIQVISNLLTWLISFYYKAYEEKHTFTASILIENENYLIPYLCEKTPNIEYCPCYDNYDDEVYKDNFNIEQKEFKGTWEKNKLQFYTDKNLPDFVNLQNFSVKSVALYPLVFEETILEALKKAEIKTKKKQGFLCVDSSDPEIFSKSNTHIHSEILRPFATRILYEISVQFLKESKK